MAGPIKPMPNHHLSATWFHLPKWLLAPTHSHRVGTMFKIAPLVESRRAAAGTDCPRMLVRLCCRLASTPTRKHSSREPSTPLLRSLDPRRVHRSPSSPSAPGQVHFLLMYHQLHWIGMSKYLALLSALGHTHHDALLLRVVYRPPLVVPTASVNSKHAKDTKRFVAPLTCGEHQQTKTLRVMRSQEYTRLELTFSRETWLFEDSPHLLVFGM